MPSFVRGFLHSSILLSTCEMHSSCFMSMGSDIFKILLEMLQEISMVKYKTIYFLTLKWQYDGHEATCMWSTKVSVSDRYQPVDERIGTACSILKSIKNSPAYIPDRFLIGNEEIW